MSAVDRMTGEVLDVMPADHARRLTEQIRTAVDATWELVRQAYEGRAWVSLGYSSWDDYCTREFGSSRLRLPREERQEVVASLRESGLSIRAIAAATGTAPNTVQSDLRRQVSQSDTPAPAQADDEPTTFTVDPEPASIVGTDGKQYPARTAEPNPKPRRSPLIDDARNAGWQLRKAIERMERIATDDRFPTNRAEVAAEWTDHLSHAIDVCQDFLDGFTTEP